MKTPTAPVPLLSTVSRLVARGKPGRTMASRSACPCALDPLRKEDAGRVEDANQCEQACGVQRVGFPYVFSFSFGLGPLRVRAMKTYRELRLLPGPWKCGRMPGESQERGRLQMPPVRRKRVARAVSSYDHVRVMRNPRTGSRRRASFSE
ncbi:hypothetical protein OH76DRAFT_1179667 [Lentinus brumalis]|uniref:Uncharacterized protein n=1 Tax=Lentinus brumalis TaxID=2498619 RepID=A0A371CTT1_9APHY|nr:hypothetical protein OH76DRAFT_1179667 [Polyporus brumalis]